MLYARATTSDALISRIIRAATGSQFSHIELALAGGYVGAHIQGGVKLRRFDYEPDCRYQFFRIDLPDLNADRVIEFFRSQLDKPYDLTGCIGCGLHRDWHQPDSWFCSEIFIAAFEYGLFPLLNPITVNNCDRVPPQMVLLSPYLIPCDPPNFIPRR